MRRNNNVHREEVIAYFTAECLSNFR